MDSRHTLGKSRTRAAKDSPVGLFSTQLGRCGRWPWVAWNLHQASLIECGEVGRNTHYTQRDSVLCFKKMVLNVAIIYQS